MIRITYDYDEAEVAFCAKHVSKAFGGMVRSESEIPRVDDWVAGDPARCDALGALRAFGDDHPEAVRFETGQLVATHAAVAALSAGQARALGLPARPPFVLATDVSGIIGSPSFKLTARWLDGVRAVATTREGAFLKSGKGAFLIPEPLFSALELADGFDAQSLNLQDHWSTLVRFRRLLDSETTVDDPSEMSDFLRGLRIYTATAMSLALNGEVENVDFDPVLFDAETLRKAEAEGRPLSEADGLLSSEELQSFQSHDRVGFRAFDDAKRTYLLGGNTYLLIDADLQIALRIVREKQQADAAERRAFAANPRAAIIERLALGSGDGVLPAGGAVLDVLDEDAETIAERLFVETPEYADRAVGIGLWERPNFDFLPAHAPNVWLPESFALELGGVWIHIDAQDVPDLREKISRAIKAGQKEVKYGEHAIPATPEVIDKLGKVDGYIRPDNGNDTRQGDAEPSAEGDLDDGDSRGDDRPTVVLVHENFVEKTWTPPSKARRAIIPADEAAIPVLGTALLTHQRESLGWQIKAWQSGHHGVLNADDQGLGKTLQTLAFLAWLQENMNQGPREDREPVLIVAPTGLLRVWEAEAQSHLRGIGLGARLDVHGAGLRNLRNPGLTGRDTDDGKPRLDFGNLRSAIENGNGHRWWLLTTYETLANYQHSVREIRFAAVVFDEIQKIKNPSTLIALAGRSVNADFRIGLTGTPIENHVADLWAIMDAIYPGRLGTLKEYVERYRIVTEDRMRELHARLFKPLKSGHKKWPPVAQRRFKDGVIDDLPRKDYRLYPATMPDRQARAYEQARQHLGDGAQGAALRLLHHVRGVSLHPESPETLQENLDDYFVRSARLQEVRRILSRVRKKRERALIFTENRRMQAFVAQWLRYEFALDRVRIINGATTITRRRQFVAEFQEYGEAPGFAVMILSPRAAGVGLTLTAATHVIHLSRWWNPAVEEQCNDRIYRIGQTRDVTVHLPLAVHPAYREGSFDCVLNDLMRRKTSLARAALWPPINGDFDNQMLVTGVLGADSFDPTEVDQLDWAAFEEWIMDRAKQSGDWNASGTPISGDAGADVVLHHRRRKATSALVQAKHTTNLGRTIDTSAVHEILHAKDRYKEHDPELVVITNARGFTESARQLALNNDVRLVDRDRLGLWPSHVLA